MKKEPISAPQMTHSSQMGKTNEQSIRRLFELFKSANIPAIIDMCADECDWKHGGNPDIIPFSQHYKGKANIDQFFQAVGESIEVSQIADSNYQSTDHELSHDFYVQARVKKTGKPYAVKVRYVWSFDENGKILRYRSYGDLTEVEAAFRP